MTIVIASLEGGRLAFMSDSRISGSAATESGAKVFALPIEVVARRRGGFHLCYRSAIGFAFSGSTLAALNTHAFAAACLQNLIREEGAPQISIAEVADFVARAARMHIADVVSRSRDGLVCPERYYFRALLGGYCDRERQFVLYQLEPALVDHQFGVHAIRMDLQPRRFYSIGSATEAFVQLTEQMANRGLARGAYGALELLLVLGERDDVGGWIQYGEATRGKFRLRPTMRPNLEDPAGPVGISFMGFDAATVGQVGGHAIGYQVRGPAPPVDWIHAAVRGWR